MNISVISKKVLKYSYIAGAVISAFFIVRKELTWASGLMVGVIWSVANFTLTMNLFEIVLLQKDRKRITRMLLIKFPVLYLAGYLILTSKLFAIGGILTGIGITLLIIGAVTAWPKRA